MTGDDSKRPNEGPSGEPNGDGRERSGDGRPDEPDRRNEDGPPDERRGRLVERADGEGYDYKPPEMSRRAVAKWLAGISGTAAVGSIAVSAISALSDAGVGSGRGTSYKTVYVKGTHLVNENGNRLTVGDALPAGKGNERVVLPEKKNGKPLKTSSAPTLLLRFSEGEYQTPTKLDWTVKGYAAYSMVCTHEGCLVSGRDGKNLHCPCHNSEYNPLEGAKVIGGPAPRPLPQLPIGVSTKGELLVATGPFEAPIGPQ
ncbi:Rieske (2Fe-2S) protein (plasmid) [Haladaptatus sp. SPP-AMP-3]|uniref:ubiquinol-cytochrome c reductase iron-sulfur subunit n=1 Tax=Haladaptatus sp. SPP-AMP-3 TaxID=3121295 RepID=UPI003C2BB756